MSKLRFSAATLALATLTGMSFTNAQQPNTELPTLNQEQPAGVQTEHAERYQARRISADANRQQGPTVTQAVVQKLIKSNEAEIELATLAQQQSDNQQIQQYARTIIQDHRSLNQSLQQHSSSQQVTAQQPASDQAPGRRTGGTHPEAAEDSSTHPEAAEDSSDPTALKRMNSPHLATQSTGTVPQELCDIGEQACENALQMTKEMLGKYQGQDFSMAFLGQQCVAHTMMLAELRAIETTGPQELREIAGQAAGTVKQHLEMAKQLAKQLEDDRKVNG
ncbi:DUF4142 domain-containing protein [Stieleria sp. TO1_6]|uniref:DUF4142 domain-containing protein n=1 Tax=Stieleria tagensis TaxID=2956795 RepID=UPI00209B6194|nr:DUF4142 domain-containing protein [Stieleria tagensis]MCO8123179.1 DUF4142 domain-containing protein [Stieleria tagensis]